jgi:hypothetical protein
MLALGMNVVIGLSLATGAPADGLPQDARLETVRAHLQEIFLSAQATTSRSDLIVSKVREGLAKKVSPASIEAGAVRLLDGLRVARQVLDERREQAAPGLLRPLAEAAAAGVPVEALESLISGAPEPGAQRALEVLTDLSLHGYPARAASILVRTVLSQEPQSLERLPRSLERLQGDYALSPAEAMDALARGLASGESVPASFRHAADDEQRGRGHGAAEPRGAGNGAGHSAWAAVRISARRLPPGRR